MLFGKRKGFDGRFGPADDLGSLAPGATKKGVGDMRKLWRRPSPAMIVACVALLLALGGTGVAAVSQVARNSVGPAQLQFGAVTRPKIRNNAVNSDKVANRSLLRSDFAPGQLPAGPTGPQGPAGPAGPAGAAGPAGVIGAVTVRPQSIAIADPGAGFGKARITSQCAANEKAISGGTHWSDDNATYNLVTSELQPVQNAQNQVTGFSAVGINDSGQTSTFTVYALCYVG